MSWKIDAHRSQIQFTVRHMMISKVRGTFEKFSGVIDFDERNPANTTVDVTIDAATLNTRDQRRDDYLRSSDGLNVAIYPKLTFAGRRVEPISANNGRLTGDLTILDTTHEVVLDVRFSGRVRSRNEIRNASFKASTIISRKAWGLEWNTALEAGGWLVGDKIKIDIKLEIVRV